jgi:hypothetical protein
MEKELLMHNHDGRNGARARSARIRSSHDYEATQLESMRRRTRALAEDERPSRVARLRAIVVRLSAQRAPDSIGEDVGVAEPAEGMAGAS